MSKNTRTRIILTAVAALLLVTMAVGGTMAWLVDNSEPVTNEFEISKVGVELDETEATYKMIPGHTIAKDPNVKLTENSEDSFVFVKVTESANFDDYMTYGLADGWEVLEGYDKEADEYIVYRTMKAADPAVSILADNKVTVKDGVTNAMMDTAQTNVPTLTFVAYAVQQYKTNGSPFTATEAWAAYSNPTAEVVNP